MRRAGQDTKGSVRFRSATLRRMAMTASCIATIGSSEMEAQRTTAGTPSRSQVIDAARSVIRDARYATFVTIDASGQPQARIVDPATPDTDMTIWIATNPLTRKVADVRRDGRVTLLYFNAPASEYVSVIGTASLVTDTTTRQRHWKADWAPFYRAGPRGPDYVLIQVKPRRLEVVSAKHNVNSDPRTWKPTIVDFGAR